MNELDEERKSYFRKLKEATCHSGLAYYKLRGILLSGLGVSILPSQGFASKLKSYGILQRCVKI